MKLPKLSKRLECVAKLAARSTAESADAAGTGRAAGNVIADIGCDHGLMPIKLIREGLFRKAILSDIRRAPLERAASNIKLYAPGQASAFDLRLGSGLETVSPGEADVVTVSGLSGLTIAEILAGSPGAARSVPRFVLQPNTLHRELRLFLWNNGFEITFETLAAEGGRIYLVMECRSETKPGGAECRDGISAVRAEFGDFIPAHYSAVNERFLAARLREALAIKEQILNGPDASLHCEKLREVEELTDGITRILGFYKESEGCSDDSQ